MSDMLGDNLSGPLPPGFDLEQWLKEMGDNEQFESLWKLIPVFEHPRVEAPTNKTYLEFTRIRSRMGLDPSSENDTQYNLIRATCEYLTAKAGGLPELANVARFLELGGLLVLRQLESYPPVVPLLAYAQHLATYRPDSPNPSGHVEIAVQDAQDYVQGCLDFQRQQSEQEAEQRAQQREQAAYEAKQRKMEAKQKVDNLIRGLIIFAAGIGTGLLIAYSQ